MYTYVLESLYLRNREDKDRNGCHRNTLIRWKREDEIKELQLEIRQKCNAAKQKWINEQYKVVEEFGENHRYESMHKKTKELTGRKRKARGNVFQTKMEYW